MKDRIRIMLAALALVLLPVSAHETGTPGHKHALEIDRSKYTEGLMCSNPGGVYVHFKESVGECGGWGGNECSYTCLYQVWADWEADDGYVGRDTEPGGGGYYKCNIANSWDPMNAHATFYVRKPSWASESGAWGVYVRDGWGRAECRFN